LDVLRRIAREHVPTIPSHVPSVSNTSYLSKALETFVNFVAFV